MPSLGQSVHRVAEKVLGVELPDEDIDLIATGLLDSLSLVNLVVELEQELGVELPFADLDVDDFRTVRALTRRLQQCREVA